MSRKYSIAVMVNKKQTLSLFFFWENKDESFI